MVCKAPHSLANIFICMFSCILSLLLPCHAFSVKFASSLLHLIFHPSQYRTFETLTRRWFGKTAITLRSKLEIGLPTRRGPNLTSKAANSESGRCFKFRSENCGISIGHTFCPIELKIVVLPILVIQNQKNNNKKGKKVKKLDFF
jgi:hypothetical protein